MKVKITYLATNKKIKAIKVVRQYANLSLKEAKAVVDAADPNYNALGTYAPADAPVFEINPSDFSAVVNALAEDGTVAEPYSSDLSSVTDAIDLALNAVAVFGSRDEARDGLRQLFANAAPDDTPVVITSALRML